MSTDPIAVFVEHGAESGCVEIYRCGINCERLG